MSREMLHNINTLAFSGGGAKGYAYVGLVKYLEEQGLVAQIKTIAGCSIGSLVAVLLNLGYCSTEMRQLMYRFDIKAHLSPNIVSLFENFGLDNFEGIKAYLETLFLAKNYSATITFRELYQRTGIHLILNTVCLNLKEIIYLDHETRPDLAVIEGLRRSVALCFAFTSVREGTLHYVDGGLLDDLPLGCLQHKEPHEVLAARLINRYNFSRFIDDFGQYFYQIFRCLYDRYNQLREQEVSSERFRGRVIAIYVDEKPYGIFNLHATSYEKIKLEQKGYQATFDFFQSPPPQSFRKKIDQATQTKIIIKRRQQHLQPS